MNRRVVITGLGPVTPIGMGAKDFFAGLLAMQTCIQPIPPDYEKKYKFKSRFHVPFPEFRLSDFGIHSPFVKMIDKPSKLSLAGAQLAWQDASSPSLENAAVILGIGIGSLFTSFQSHVAHTVENTPLRYNRMVIPMQMPNAVSAWISILFKARGPNYTINASCASGTIAIGEAYGKVAAGNCDVALTGGVECLEDPTGSIMRGFDSLNVLTKSTDGRPQPFSKARSGFLFSDGAGCVLVLEELQHARNRGAKIYCEIADYACVSDAYNIVQFDPSGARIAALMERLSAGKPIDYINAHGTGTVENDALEASVIQKLFGKPETQPCINSTKGLLGHTLGASGALEAAVAALSIREGKIHGNLLQEPVDGLNLPLQAVSMPVERALSLSYGFGGHNAGLLLQRCDENE